MIYLFWPGHAIPDWLLHVEFSGTSKGAPVFKHDGWGFVIRFRGRLIACLLRGTFAYINGAGMSVEVTGGGRELLVLSGMYFATTCFYLKDIEP